MTDKVLKTAVARRGKRKLKSIFVNDRFEELDTNFCSYITI